MDRTSDLLEHGVKKVGVYPQLGYVMVNILGKAGKVPRILSDLGDKAQIIELGDERGVPL